MLYLLTSQLTLGKLQSPSLLISKTQSRQKPALPSPPSSGFFWEQIAITILSTKHGTGMQKTGQSSFQLCWQTEITMTSADIHLHLLGEWMNDAWINT